MTATKQTVQNKMFRFALNQLQIVTKCDMHDAVFVVSVSALSCNSLNFDLF